MMKKNPKNNEREELAELFRMDFISNMKIADSEILDTDEVHRLTDPWRHEWNCGVQVPIKDKRDIRPPDSILIEDANDIQPGPSKNASNCAQQYDADLLDEKWLILFNAQAKKLGLPQVSKTTFELAMEQLELASLKRPNRDYTCPNMIEHDDTVCDVCRSPTWEDGNKIVFCDSCNVAVHQMCYGIKRIPKGSWYCRPCAVGQSPKCSLCPNRGGAMKSNRSCDRWLHVSCALWVPEIEFENKETMEPAINFTKIPNNRFNLRCSLCSNRGGVCIQCSFKSCRAAYHVTCAQKHRLQLLTVPEFQSYCLKHADPSRQLETPDPSSQTNNRLPSQKNGDRLSDETKDWIANTRHLFLIAKYSLSEYTAQSILIYWRLKRLARNLCYMIERREKLKRQEYSTGLEYIQKLYDHFTELKSNSAPTTTSSKSTAHRILIDSHLPNTVGFKSPPPPSSSPTGVHRMSLVGQSDKPHSQPFRGVDSKRVKMPSRFNHKIQGVALKNYRSTRTTSPERLLDINTPKKINPKNFTLNNHVSQFNNCLNHTLKRRNFGSNVRKRSSSTSKIKDQLNNNLIIDAKRQRRNVMPFCASV